MLITKTCPLCGISYDDKKGHSPSDCWGLVHQHLIRAASIVRDLEYKLEKAERIINESKGKEVEK